MQFVPIILFPKWDESGNLVFYLCMYIVVNCGPPTIGYISITEIKALEKLKEKWRVTIPVMINSNKASFIYHTKCILFCNGLIISYKHHINCWKGIKELKMLLWNSKLAKLVISWKPLTISGCNSRIKIVTLTLIFDWSKYYERYDMSFIIATIWIKNCILMVPIQKDEPAFWFFSLISNSLFMQ